MGPWRREVIARYGFVCVVDGSVHSGMIETHHIIYRSQGGRDEPENGVPLCTKHHQQIHSRIILLKREWLTRDAVGYLKDAGWVDWDQEGLAFGRGLNGFAALSLGVDDNPF